LAERANHVSPNGISALSDEFEKIPPGPVSPAAAKSDTVASGPRTKTTCQEFDFLDRAQAPDELGRLGPYRVMRIIGTGGMGVVFQAEDPSLRRLVAIKAMLPAVVGRGFNRQRFLREAQAMAAIEHEHLVTIYQVGEQRDIPYLVMQYLQGESLEARLARDTRLPHLEALRIARETASALSAAHAHGLIHRDVKPANIWLEGPRGRVKLLDFGLARLTAEDTQLTRAGVILGTPAYMAPEQARGKLVDHLCDLFSLGCVLYEMCAGRLPFHGSDVMSRLVSLVMDEPAPLWETASDTPRELSELVLSLLAKTPSERPPSAHAVVVALTELEEKLVAPPRIDDIDLSLPAPAPRPAAGDSEELVEPLPPLPEPVRPERGIPAVDLTRPVERLDELSGRLLGRFELGAVIGRGYHGATFRARDVKGVQTVALKVFKPLFPHDADELDRFVRGTKVLLTLRHPNLVTVHAVGRNGPYVWLATELVEGENLGQMLRRERGDDRANWRLAFRLTVQLARALEYAGQQQQRHGNITPSNILVVNSTKDFKLNDLMLHLALKKSALRQAVRREKHEAEAVYLAPELLDTQIPRDEITDLYSVGVVAYHLLTGKLPFESDDPEELEEMILNAAPAKPRKYRKNIPNRFEWVVLQMLSKDRKYRFQTPKELLFYLDRIAEEHGIEV
jgi:serine/threonine protein kinase